MSKQLNQLVCAISLLITSNVVHSSDDNTYYESYLNKLSEPSIVAICKESDFLKLSGLNSMSCQKILSNYTSICGDIIKPLFPSLDGDESNKEIEMKFNSLGILYAICLKTNALKVF